jgi:glucan-binding YG repeat protein
MSKKTRSISVARIRPVVCAAVLIASLTVPAMPVWAEGSDSASSAIKQEQTSEGKEAVSAGSTGSGVKASDAKRGTASEDRKEPAAPAAPVAKDGWSKNAEGKRIYRRNGKLVTGVASIDGKYYLFGEDGALTEAIGFQKLADGDTVYVTKDASLATGWQQISGACYLFSKTGIMQKGWQKVDGIWYWLDPASGIRQGGWLWNNGSWYWLDQNTGAMQTGWAKIGGTWYYFYSSGAMATGWVKDGQTWYWCASSGAMQTGWVKVGGSWYYLYGSGAMATGWVYDAGSWYYLSSSGAMVTGWVKVGGTWYYLSGSGAMQTGWLKQNGVWYWLDGSGAMATGWRFIDGKWNAFDNPSGVWRTNDGRLVNGWYTAQAISSPTNWFVLVDDINTKVMIYYWDIDQWMPLYIFDCSTGAWSMRTVHGTFSVGMKGYAFGYGHGYTAYYYTQIYGDYLFHSILYNEGTWIPLDPVLNSHRSHGCVRLAPENAKWIYDNIPRGTTVHIF